MKPEHKTAIEEKYMVKLFKNGKTLRDLDGLQCPCDDRQSQACKLFGAFPQYCKPIQKQINNIINTKQNDNTTNGNE